MTHRRILPRGGGDLPVHSRDGAVRDWATGPRFGRLRRTATARWDADVLDGLVDAELGFVRGLPVHLRSCPAEVLALMVMLAQDHRHYAQGWITRRELRRRAQCALDDMDAVRAQLAPLGPPR
ncbi:MAG: hypothetical protein ACR2FQ_02295 [Pseudonocardiaceae bacterium]